MVKENVTRDEMVKTLGEALVKELENKPYDEKDEYDLEEFTDKDIWLLNKDPTKNIMGTMRKDDKTGEEIYILVLPANY